MAGSSGQAYILFFLSARVIESPRGQRTVPNAGSLSRALTMYHGLRNDEREDAVHGVIAFERRQAGARGWMSFPSSATVRFQALLRYAGRSCFCCRSPGDSEVESHFSALEQPREPHHDCECQNDCWLRRLFSSKGQQFCFRFDLPSDSSAGSSRRRKARVSVQQSGVISSR